MRRHADAPECRPRAAAGEVPALCRRSPPPYTAAVPGQSRIPLLALASLTLAALATGCAQRTLDITSDPPGALVYLNGQEVGRTPMRYDFKWYGDYDVALRRDGYETLKTHRKLAAPLYEVPPIDLAAEMLGAKDVREWNFVLTPADAAAADPQALINRAESLKEDLRSSRYTRLPTTAPATRPTEGE